MPSTPDFARSQSLSKLIGQISEAISELPSPENCGSPLLEFPKFILAHAYVGHPRA
jgi:hypothetical protein